jgi:uncharacterized protein
MKTSTSLLTTLLLLSTNLLLTAASPTDVVGNWKGTLDVGGTKLRLVFKITKAPGGALSAKLDSLDQGARDIPVDTVTVKDDKLRLEVKNIQGLYEGTLDKAGKKASGQWQQGPQSLPLTLERSQGNSPASEPEALSPADLAASKLAAQKVAGTWNGALAAGGASLRLMVKISKAPSGAATGTVDSLDQGAKDIPLSAITYKDGKVRFEARGIGGVYEGALGADGAGLTGEWHQAGQTMPLNFNKASVSK